MHIILWYINHLTPRSDGHVTSPYYIQTLSSKQFMSVHQLDGRIKNQILEVKELRFKQVAKCSDTSLCK